MDAAMQAEERPGIWKEVLSDTRSRTVIGADVVSVGQAAPNLCLAVPHPPPCSERETNPQIYDPSLVPPLVSAIGVLLASPEVAGSAVISATVRNPSTLDLFVATCRTSMVGMCFRYVADRRCIGSAGRRAGPRAYVLRRPYLLGLCAGRRQ